MLTTILIVVGAISVGIGSVCTAVGGIMQNKEQQETQKKLIDYEYKLLGRRDGK